MLVNIIVALGGLIFGFIIGAYAKSRTAPSLGEAPVDSIYTEALAWGTDKFMAQLKQAEPDEVPAIMAALKEFLAKSQSDWNELKTPPVYAEELKN